MIPSRGISRVLSAILVAILLACTPAGGPTEPTVPAIPLLGGLIEETVDGATGLLSGVLLSCRPLPSETVEQAVGPAGGVVRVGPHRLDIPRGALTRTVTIRAEMPSERVNSVKFSPEGLRFGKPATLTLSYANCASLLAPKRIAYTNDLLVILELLASKDQPRSETVSARLDHFSRYAVAW